MQASLRPTKANLQTLLYTAIGCLSLRNTLCSRFCYNLKTADYVRDLGIKNVVERNRVGRAAGTCGRLNSSFFVNLRIAALMCDSVLLLTQSHLFRLHWSLPPSKKCPSEFLHGSVVGDAWCGIALLHPLPLWISTRVCKRQFTR